MHLKPLFFLCYGLNYGIIAMLQKIYIYVLQVLRALPFI
jgi:hypothetical protein